MDSAKICIRQAFEELVALPFLVSFGKDPALHDGMLTNAVNWLDDWSADDDEVLATSESMSDPEIRAAVVKATRSLHAILDTLPEPKSPQMLLSSPGWKETGVHIARAFELLRIDLG